MNTMKIIDKGLKTSDLDRVNDENFLMKKVSPTIVCGLFRRMNTVNSNLKRN